VPPLPVKASPSTHGEKQCLYHPCSQEHTLSFWAIMATACLLIQDTALKMRAEIAQAYGEGTSLDRGLLQGFC